MMININEIHVILQTIVDHDEFGSALYSINHNTIRNARYNPKVKYVLKTLRELFVKYGYVDPDTLEIKIHKHTCLIVMVFSNNLDNFKKLAEQLDQNDIHCHYMEVLHYVNMHNMHFTHIPTDSIYWENLITEWKELEDVLLTDPICNGPGILMAIESDSEIEIFKALFDYIKPQSMYENAIGQILEYTIENNLNKCFEYTLKSFKHKPQDLYETCIKYDNLEALKICMQYIPDMKVSDKYKEIGKISTNPEMQKFFGVDINFPIKRVDEKQQIEDINQCNVNLLQQIQEMDAKIKDLETQLLKYTTYYQTTEKMMDEIDGIPTVISKIDNGRIYTKMEFNIPKYSPYNLQIDEVKELTDQLKSFMVAANFKETSNKLQSLESENAKLKEAMHKLETEKQNTEFWSNQTLTVGGAANQIVSMDNEKITQLETSHKKLIDEIESQKKYSKDLEDRYKEVIRQKVDKDNQIEELTRELMLKESKLQSFEIIMQDKRTQFDHYTKEIEEKDKELNELKTKLQKLKTMLNPSDA